jgi:thiol-disulfide isomerase/thioredoxin
VAFTQMLFMITVPALIILAVCLSRIATSFLLYDDVNVKSIAALFCGMYILVEAVSAICYLASCFFSQSRKSLGMGGGLTAWFFIASLMGMFGSDNMVNSGMGVKELSVFNKLTLIGLYDIDSLATVGEKDVCYDFLLNTLDGSVLEIKTENNKIHIKSLENKLVVLNFFATWCPACKVEIPALVRLQNEYKNDLVVVSVLLEEFKSDEEIKNFAKEFGINYKISKGCSTFATFVPIKAAS